MREIDGRRCHNWPVNLRSGALPDPDGGAAVVVDATGWHLFTLLPVPALIVDATGDTIRRANRAGAELLASPEGQLPGRSLADVAGPVVAHIVSTVAGAPDAGTRACVVETADGRAVPVQLFVSGGADGPSAQAVLVLVPSADVADGDTYGDVEANGKRTLAGRVAELERTLVHISRLLEQTSITPRRTITGLSAAAVPGVEALTDREWHIVQRLLDGYRVPAIAAELSVSQSTVRNYLSAAFRKLSVSSQAQLIERFRHGDGAGRPLESRPPPLSEVPAAR